MSSRSNLPPAIPRQPGPSAPTNQSLRRASVYGNNARPRRQTNLPDLPPIPSSTSSASIMRPSASSSGLKPPTPPSGNAYDKRKSRVDAQLFKRRQSGADASSHAIPLPTTYNLRELTSGAKSNSALVDLDELNTDSLNFCSWTKHLDIQRHLGKSRSGSNLEELRSLKAKLKTSLRVTAGDIQQSFMANYVNFITISKELSALEVDLLELKGVFEEWKSVPDSLELPVEEWGLGSSTLSSSSRRNRNSTADLDAVYRSQLEALWEGVEGSQNLLPPVPGRRIITESAAFTELNAATYKPRGPVHLFLLNDSLLVAIKRRRQMGSKLKLVADKCFTLSEIVVVDLKDNNQLVNAVKIKRSKEQFIFCAERVEDKRALLGSFKKVAEEMINKKRKQNLWEAESRREHNPASMSSPALTQQSKTSSFNAAQFFGLDESSNKDNAWIDNVGDQLAVNIALREFESAVTLSEQGKAALAQLEAEEETTLAAQFKLVLDERIRDLRTALLRDLRSPTTLGKSTVVKCAGWLGRLGELDQAREAFLDGRSMLVKTRVRQIKFGGDISSYVGELAIVIFTLIKNTCEWYLAAFKDNKMASGFVRWATEQMELFASMFRRQVHGADKDGDLTMRALQVTRAHSTMLRDAGLDYGFIFDQLQEGEPEPGTAV